MFLVSKDKITAFFEELDRSFFIDNEFKHLAGRDSPLPIGYGQTISQPSLVLDMTLALGLEAESRVLEIGTGSGFQTALLAEFCQAVYTVERIQALSVVAQERLESIGYQNVFFKVGDGSKGWPEEAPYDRIIVTAAAQSIPEELLEQLAAGGRMVIPIGDRDQQHLILLNKDERGRCSRTNLGGVRFVEFKGKYGWS